MMCDEAPESKRVERLVFTTQVRSSGESTSLIDVNEKSPGRLSSTVLNLSVENVVQSLKCSY